MAGEKAARRQKRSGMLESPNGPVAYALSPWGFRDCIAPNLVAVALIFDKLKDLFLLQGWTAKSTGYFNLELDHYLK